MTAPYGTEKPYNALRLSLGLSQSETKVNVFLLADGVWAAQAGQNVPRGYYNIERMLGLAISSGAKVKMCGTCMEARGLAEEKMVEGAERATMADLTQWVKESENALCF